MVSGGISTYSVSNTSKLSNSFPYLWLLSHVLLRLIMSHERTRTAVVESYWGPGGHVFWLSSKLTTSKDYRNISVRFRFKHVGWTCWLIIKGWTQNSRFITWVNGLNESTLVSSCVLYKSRTELKDTQTVDMKIWLCHSDRLERRAERTVKVQEWEVTNPGVGNAEVEYRLYHREKDSFCLWCVGGSVFRTGGQCV